MKKIVLGILLILIAVIGLLLWHRVPILDDIILSDDRGPSEDASESTTSNADYTYEIASPMNQYALVMSSTPGLPLEAVCRFYKDHLDFEVHYFATEGSFIQYDGQYIKQLENVCTLPFDDHTLYWTPFIREGDDRPVSDSAIIEIHIDVLDKASGNLVESNMHTIYKEGIYYAFDQLPAPPDFEEVVQEGLGFYLMYDVPTVPFGEEEAAYPQVNDYRVAHEPLFTQSDLLYVDWATQSYYFTPEFLESIGADTIDIESIDGSVLLGENNGKFIVIVDGMSVYEGYFEMSMFSSFLPVGPVIHDIDRHGISIELTGIEGMNDPRYDDRIKEVLERYELLE